MLKNLHLLRTKTDYSKKVKRKEKKGQRCDWLINTALYFFFDQLEVEPKCDFGNMTFHAFFGRYTIG